MFETGQCNFKSVCKAAKEAEKGGEKTAKRATKVGEKEAKRDEEKNC